MLLEDDAIWGLGTALALGLLIGAERERRKGVGAERAPAGVRTFTLAAVLGGAGYLVAGAAGVVAVLAILGLFGAVGYWRSSTPDPGLTTETALVLTGALGALAQYRPPLAAALGVVVTLLLASRDWLHTLVRDRVTAQELTDATLLAAAAVVILPLLPDRAIDPFGVLNPRLLWKLTVLVMLINAVGYLALRIFGGGVGLVLAGFAGGFVSSIATIGSMGSRARAQPELQRAAVAGATLSSVPTVLQLALLIGVTSPELLWRLVPALLGAGAVAAVYGGIVSQGALSVPDGVETVRGRAFQPATAVIFTVTVATVMFAAALLAKYFGQGGGVAGVTLAGFADAHSAAISAANLAATGTLPLPLAGWGVLLAFTANTLSKAIAALTTGGKAFALRVMPGLALMVLAAWLGMSISR